MNAIALSLPHALTAPGAGASDPTLVFHRREPTRDTTIDARLIAILDAPLASRETPAEGFARKERELGNAFARLDIDQVVAIYERLVVNYACDSLARKFARLTEERRERLLDFLEVLSDPVRRAGLLEAML